MNLIFLDCDGVVTSTVETPGSYLNHTPNEYGPSPSCVKRLINLCKMTNSKAIISSNWRKFDPDGKWTFNGNTVVNPLFELKKMLGEYCIGSLPAIRHQKKSTVLLNWFEEHHDEVDNFVVFDDDINECFQDIAKYGISNNFIQTDYTVGLTDDDCKKAYDILKRKNK